MKLRIQEHAKKRNVSKNYMDKEKLKTKTADWTTRPGGEESKIIVVTVIFRVRFVSVPLSLVVVVPDVAAGVPFVECSPARATACSNPVVSGVVLLLSSFCQVGVFAFAFASYVFVRLLCFYLLVVFGLQLATSVPLCLSHCPQLGPVSLIGFRWCSSWWCP
jgi:hypothetical protein